MLRAGVPERPHVSKIFGVIISLDIRIKPLDASIPRVGGLVPKYVRLSGIQVKLVQRERDIGIDQTAGRSRRDHL